MVMNFISREQVLAIVSGRVPDDVQRAIESVPSFPAPNPNELGGKNVMGQTEDEFWALVEKQDK